MENRNFEQLYAADYRAIAQEKCSKFSSRLAIIYLVYSVITSLGSLISFDVYEIEGFKIQADFTAVVTLILGGPLTAALVKIAKKVYDSVEPQVDDLFEGFKEFGKNFILYLLQNIYIFLWSLLFVVPGIIKAYAYSMAFYIKDENPELSSSECLNRSKELMNGHKWELFCLEISYIGWLLLSALTLGILSFWVLPKMEVAKYTFYRNISGQGVRTVSRETVEFDEEDFIINIE